MKSICSGTGLSGGAAIGAFRVSTAFSLNISRVSKEIGTPMTPQKGPRLPRVLVAAA